MAARHISLTESTALSFQTRSHTLCKSTTTFPPFPSYTPQLHPSKISTDTGGLLSVSTSQHLQRFVHIGSTSSTMTKRESTRNRKYKQIQERKIVQAELSLRWWHKHKCYQQFTPIVLQTNIPLHELEATENTMIQHHQAKPSLEREGQSWHSSTRWAENSEKH